MGAAETFRLLALGYVLCGTALVSAGAGALNMFLERRSDALMERTRLRPIPAGRLGENRVLAFGLLLAGAGMIVLFALVNPITGALSAASSVLYLLLYTPLKRRSWLSTPIGAVCGALPVVMGWTAATGGLAAGAVALFAVMYFWQHPHFYAIGWMYRDEYFHAGFKILPALDGTGIRTGIQTVGFTLALTAASLATAFLLPTGRVYPAGALVLGLLFLALGVWFARRRDRRSARVLFLFSLFYLPALFSLMVASKSWVG
jgi:protoheme IX farnesyltransferase